MHSYCLLDRRSYTARMSCNRSLAISNHFHFAHSRLVSFLYRSRIVPSPYSHRVSYIIVVRMSCFLVYYHILSVVRLHTRLVCSHHRQTYRVVFVAIGLHPIRLSSACALLSFPISSLQVCASIFSYRLIPPRLFMSMSVMCSRLLSSLR